MTRTDPSKGADNHVLWGGGVAILMLACCALPILIAGGALAVFAGAVTSPWVIGVGVLILAVAVLALIQRRRSGDDGRCPPDRTTDPTSEDPFRTKGPYDE